MNYWCVPAVIGGEQSPLSCYHLDVISSDTEKYFERSIDRPFGMEEVTEMLVSSIFGAVAAEQEHIRRSDGVFEAYAKRAFHRMDKGQDTGLIPEDMIMVWDSLSHAERDATSSAVLQACDKFYDFTPLAKLNIVYSSVVIPVSLHDYQLPFLVPLVVETKKGLAAIIPTVSGVFSYDSRAVSASPLHAVHTLGRMEYRQVHVWDLHDMKVFSARGAEVESAMEKL